MKLLNAIKTFTITALTVLAVYQASRLWFEYSLDHDLFYMLALTDQREPDKELAAAFCVPYRIVANYSNNKFGIKYSGLMQSGIYKHADAAVSALIKDGEYLGISDINYNRLLERRSVIMEYAFRMPCEIYAGARGLKSNPFKTAGFTSIILALDEDSSDRLIISFLDGESAYEYSVKNISLYDNIKEEILKSQRESEGGLYYISSKLNSNKNFYFPKWEGGDYHYSAMRIGADYYSQELLNVGREIEANVNPFFENPSAKLFYNNNGVLTFSDSNKVVKYFDNDILEYTNYKREYKKGGSFLQDYAQALSFIREDAMNRNEYYLSGFEEDGGIRHFYFDYVYNDFPVTINYGEILGSGESPGEGGDGGDGIALNHAIEISFEDGTLYKYKKLCYSFSNDETTEYAASLDIIDYINLAMEMPPEDIESISTGYYINKKYDKVRNLGNTDPESDVNRARLYCFIKPADGTTLTKVF